MFIGSKSCGGDSLSSVLFANNGTRWEIETIPVEDFITTRNLKEEKLFFKIDIEGGEYHLIPVLNDTFSRYNSILLLSLHPDLLSGLRVNGNINISLKIST